MATFHSFIQILLYHRANDIYCGKVFCACNGGTPSQHLFKSSTHLYSVIMYMLHLEHSHESERLLLPYVVSEHNKATNATLYTEKTNPNVIAVTNVIQIKSNVIIRHALPLKILG